MSKPDYDQLYTIAEDQGGYFSAAQAGEAGFSWERLSNTAKSGGIQRVYRGIYRLSRFPASRFEDLHIASLRTGPDSVISHESALAVYDLSDVLPARTHIIIPGPDLAEEKTSSFIPTHSNKMKSPGGRAADYIRGTHSR